MGPEEPAGPRRDVDHRERSRWQGLLNSRDTMSYFHVFQSTGISQNEC